jgi:hypothetical protein
LIGYVATAAKQRSTGYGAESALARGTLKSSGTIHTVSRRTVKLVDVCTECSI